MPQVKYVSEYMGHCKISCGSPCSGLVVTSYNKNDPSRKLRNKFYSSINQYKKFKKMFEIDPAKKGDYLKE